MSPLVSFVTMINDTDARANPFRSCKRLILLFFILNRSFHSNMKVQIHSFCETAPTNLKPFGGKTALNKTMYIPLILIFIVFQRFII